jgi:hypothetical protein
MRMIAVGGLASEVRAVGLAAIASPLVASDACAGACSSRPDRGERDVRCGLARSMDVGAWGHGRSNRDLPRVWKTEPHVPRWPKRWSRCPSARRLTTTLAAFSQYVLSGPCCPAMRMRSCASSSAIAPNSDRSRGNPRSSAPFGRKRMQRPCMTNRLVDDHGRSGSFRGCPTTCHRSTGRSRIRRPARRRLPARSAPRPPACA